MEDPNLLDELQRFEAEMAELTQETPTAEEEGEPPSTDPAVSPSAASPGAGAVRPPPPPPPPNIGAVNGAVVRPPPPPPIVKPPMANPQSLHPQITAPPIPPPPLQQQFAPAPRQAYSAPPQHPGPQQFYPPPQPGGFHYQFSQPGFRPPIGPQPPAVPGYQSHLLQAKSLFEKDQRMITAEALDAVKKALQAGDGDPGSSAPKKKPVLRQAAGQKWADPTLAEFPENDHRLFVGDLGNEVNDEVLSKAFSRYATFNMAKVVRDKRTGKTRGYGFVSFATVGDMATALKEMNGKYIGNRPVKLRKSTWKERNDDSPPDTSRVKPWFKNKNKAKHTVGLHK